MLDGRSERRRRRKAMVNEKGSVDKSCAKPNGSTSETGEEEREVSKGLRRKGRKKEGACAQVSGFLNLRNFPFDLDGRR
jgi:hypothetical protein